MKAVYVKAPFLFETREIDLGEPGPGQALVRISACAICGGDMQAAGVDAINWQPFGHEIAGVIEQVGSEVHHVKPGDTVVLESSSFCGKCDSCRNGRVDLCNKAPNFWTGKSMGFSQYMLAPAECLVRYEGISAESASLVEPLGVALDLFYTADIRFGDDVLVAGLGPIGLMALKLARTAGARKIYATAHSGSAARIALAKQFGADEVFLTDKTDAVAKIKALGGVDKILATVPPKAMPELLGAARFGGVMAFIGFAPAAQSSITLDANLFHVKRLQLRSSFASPALYFPRCLELLKSGVIDAQALISHRFNLEGTGEAMRTMRDDKATVVKMVMLNE
jgi:L-iditol 2-dehydrogenase